MDEFSKSSITKLVRKAGIKVMSEECYPTISNLIQIKIDEILKNVIVVNSERKTKTIMVDDLIQSLALKNCYISKSTELN